MEPFVILYKGQLAFLITKLSIVESNIISHTILLG